MNISLEWSENNAIYYHVNVGTWQSWGEGTQQGRIDISGFLETMDQMCQTMRVAVDNMANQFTLHTDEELDPQLEAMTSPTHYLSASQSRIT